MTKTKTKDSQKMLNAFANRIPQNQPNPQPETPTDPLQAFNTRLPESLHKRLKIHAIEHNTTIQDVLHAALEQYLSKKD